MTSVSGQVVLSFGAIFFLLLTCVIGFFVYRENPATRSKSNDTFEHTSPKNSAEKFKAKTLLTPNELEFLDRLEEAVPEMRICPQVSMGALLDSNMSRADGRAYMRSRSKFSQKIIDYVAQDRETGEVVAIIELDDKTHDLEKDAKRDEMLSSAGYQTVRWHSKTKPNIHDIRTRLMLALHVVRSERS